jgi:hypothetical protein
MSLDEIDFDRLPLARTLLEKLATARRHTTSRHAALSVQVSCPPGFIVGAFDGSFARFYRIPSADVQINAGAIKYVDHCARFGSQMRFRFQLCNNFSGGRCSRGTECTYVHAVRLPPASLVHLNPFVPRRIAADLDGQSHQVAPSVQDDPSVANTYPTLPPGYLLHIHPPPLNEDSDSVIVVPSQLLIRTAGADQLFAFLSANPHTDPATIAPRHCHAFQYRRACERGPACPDVHSKVPFPGVFLQEQHARAIAPVSSHAPPVSTSSEPSTPSTQQQQSPPSNAPTNTTSKAPSQLITSPLILPADRGSSQQPPPPPPPPPPPYAASVPSYAFGPHGMPMKMQAVHAGHPVPQPPQQQVMMTSTPWLYPSPSSAAATPVGFHLPPHFESGTSSAFEAVPLSPPSAGSLMMSGTPTMATGRSMHGAGVPPAGQFSYFVSPSAHMAPYPHPNHLMVATALSFPTAPHHGAHSHYHLHHQHHQHNMSTAAPNHLLAYPLMMPAGTPLN